MKSARVELKPECSVREMKNGKRNSTTSVVFLEPVVRSSRYKFGDKIPPFDVKSQMKETNFFGFITSKTSLRVQQIFNFVSSQTASRYQTLLCDAQTGYQSSIAT